jgi:hypothetical protein
MDRQLKLRILIIVSLAILILLSNLYYFLVKIGGSVFLIEGIIQLGLSIGVITWTIILLWKMIKNPEWRGSSNYLTILLIPSLIILSGFDSLTANENTFQSNVKIRACYEGTMNTSRLYLRENGEFEDFNIGFFAHVNYVSGLWRMESDTIVLTFKSGSNMILPDKIIIKDNMLFKAEPDSLFILPYYLGHCKGLN